MKITLPTVAAFRAFALLACGLELAARVADALSSTPAALARQAAAGQWPQWVAVHASLGAPADTVGVYAGLLVASFVAFAVALWACLAERGASVRARTASKRALLPVLLLLQIAIGAVVESDLQYLVAAELAFLVPHRRALRWLAVLGVASVAVNVPVFARIHAVDLRCNIAGVTPPSTDVVALLDWALGLAFQAFAYAVGRFAASEWQGRQALAAASVALAAANRDLERAVRVAEQERIADRVHDALARHATTLRAHLEQALEQTSGRAAQAVGVAHDQAVSLGDDVRRSVAAQALAPELDLRGALAALCAGVPPLKVSFTWDAPAAPLAPAAAHTVFRLVQEALTNCIRHARASAMQVRLGVQGESLALFVADDGRGDARASADADAARTGQGLRGMRERVEAHGGRFEAGTRRDVDGFFISAWLPMASSVPTSIATAMAGRPEAGA